jgi:Fur family ferric uptake transcriptional regulator
MAASPENAPSRIEQLCAEQGLRMTGQRRVIALVLSAAHDHPDVEECIGAPTPSIRASPCRPVYRTLRLFEAKGILERHDFGAGRGRYEEATRRHHDHLIDIETGKVIEFRNEEIEQIQERVARGARLQPGRPQARAVWHADQAPARMRRMPGPRVPLPGRTRRLNLGRSETCCNRHRPLR